MNNDVWYPDRCLSMYVSIYLYYSLIILQATSTFTAKTWWCHQMETFPRYWPFVRGIHRSPMYSPHKGRWRGALMISLISAWTKGWANNRNVGDLRRHRAHYGVIIMNSTCPSFSSLAYQKRSFEEEYQILRCKIWNRLFDLGINSKFPSWLLQKSMDFH